MKLTDKKDKACLEPSSHSNKLGYMQNMIKESTAIRSNTKGPKRVAKKIIKKSKKKPSWNKHNRMTEAKLKNYFVESRCVNEKTGRSNV